MGLYAKCLTFRTLPGVLLLLSYYYTYSQHSIDSEHLALTTHTLPTGDLVITSGMYPIQTTQRPPPRLKKKITNKKQEVTRNLANIFKKKRKYVL